MASQKCFGLWSWPVLLNIPEETGIFPCSIAFINGLLIFENAHCIFHLAIMTHVFAIVVCDLAGLMIVTPEIFTVTTFVAIAINHLVTAFAFDNQKLLHN